MSATNRSDVRHPDDFYATPAWCIHRILERLELPGGNWLEPGAGEGHIIRAINRKDIKWTALELREECRIGLEALNSRPEIIITDKFITNISDIEKPLYGRHFSVAIGNPPYKLAIEFIKESLKYADIVVMLLRLDFIASISRHDFMSKHTPDIYVLPNRPSFNNKGTDSNEYAWFVWKKENLNKTNGKISLLALTPSIERQKVV